MKILSFGLLYLVTLAAADSTLDSRASGPIVDLGAAGRYLGTVQNNGAVHARKAIPYAAPPIGDLRFKPPVALSRRNNTLVDVSQDFDGVPTACVQFGTTSFSGVNAGPGQEDCLKLWIWAPAGAEKGDKLPGTLYHGGGYQNGQPPSNDCGDWVGQDKKLIAVNTNYRLGLLGFFDALGVLEEGGTANAGLLDARLGIEWVVKNIAAFGGDPKNIAIGGQSGGAGMVLHQLVLFDGKKPPFQKAIPRSIRKPAAHTIAELVPCNDAFAKSVGCNDSGATRVGAARQLKCLRALSAETIRIAALAFLRTTQPNGFAWPGWYPSIDGKSLTDQPTYLFRKGKFAKVDIMAGHVNNELARLAPAFSSNFTSVTSPLVGPGADASFLEQLDRIYPAPIANYSYNTNTYPNAQLRGLSVSDDYNAKCAAPMIVRAARARGQTAYEFRMPSQPAYLGSTHSSDSYYLQNSTASMNGNSTEIGVALEWRAYVASFIRHGDPNTEKLSTAPKWYQSSAETRYDVRA